MKKPPLAVFETTFTQDVCDVLLEIVHSTYELAIASFNLARPYSDANTFGTELYRFGGRKLSEAAETQPNILTTVQEHPMFVHRVGDFELLCHRVAKRPGADIWHSFPNPETEGVQRQSSLFLPGYEPDLAKVKTAVLAHIGNENVGVCGVHLCLPVNNGDGELMWGHVHTLYARTLEAIEAGSADLVPAPAVDVAPAVVRRRVKKSGQ